MNSLFISASPYASLLGRLLISVLFVMAGVNKAMNYGGTAGYFESLGLPGIVTPLVIILEVICGLAIIVGFQTRLSAFLLGGFTALSAIVAHANFGDQTQMNMFMKNFAIAGGFLFLVANGAGKISLDHKLYGNS